jgi:hypothetical protein
MLKVISYAFRALCVVAVLATAASLSADHKRPQPNEARP